MNTVLQMIYDNYTGSDREMLVRAYHYAEQAHAGQKRASGEAYFIHPCAVAQILIELGLDAATVAAAFLHDVIEDTPVTEEDIRARKFHITGIYETGFADYDKLFVLADIRQVRRLNDWEDDQVSGIELLVDNYDHLDQISEGLYFEMANLQDRNGNTFFVRSIKDLNPMIFSWLDVLDINVVVILVLMLAVAGFTMISGLLIIILERTNMIGILKALGQNNRSIRKVFLYVSFFLIGRGMLWGNIIALLICLLQSQMHILKLDPSIYYLDAVPVDLNITSWILLNIGTLFISMLMMLGPSYLITKISPAKSIIPPKAQDNRIPPR